MLPATRSYALPKMRNQGPILTWIVDDTGFPKKGKHSVGVASTVANWKSRIIARLRSLSPLQPLMRVFLLHDSLYLPEKWIENSEFRCRAGVQENVSFQAKLRWRIERDYQELKQEIGLRHFEGRGWRDFHPSCHSLHRCLRLLGGRAQFFFPFNA